MSNENASLYFHCLLYNYELYNLNKGRDIYEQNCNFIKIFNTIFNWYIHVPVPPDRCGR